jgi:hypothetical protein
VSLPAPGRTNRLRPARVAAQFARNFARRANCASAQGTLCVRGVDLVRNVLVLLFVLLSGSFTSANGRKDIGGEAPVADGTPTWTNVKSPPYNARGDGVTDDTAAILAAVNAIPAHGTIYFPATQKGYLVSATIAFGNKFVNLRGDKGRSVIRGNVNGPLIAMGTGGSATGPEIAGLTLNNTNTAGTGILLAFFVSATIRDCSFVGNFIGLDTHTNTFTLHVENSRFQGPPGSPIGSIGVLAGGHTLISASDIVGYDHGLRLSGTTVTVVGCRLEVNRVAIMVGIDFTGAATPLSRSLIAGNSFEANDTAIEVKSASSTRFEAMGIQGSVNSPSAQSVHGIVLVNGSQLTFADIGVIGSFSRAAIKQSAGTEIAWERVNAGNALSTGKVWDVDGAITSVAFRETNYRLRADDATDRTIQRHGVSSYLSAIDNLNPAVQGKNMRGKDIPVAQAAKSVHIAFTTAHTPGQAAISTAVAGMGRGTLAPGTYYYIASAVSEHGESGAFGEKRVVVSAANNQVAISFFPMTADGFKRRIYRGETSGIYDGYFETALNSNATFTDTGAAFTALKSPPSAMVDETSMIEPDANYAVLVVPNWSTTCFVTNKATTGFTINFGTAAPPGATVDWLMVR